MKYTLIVIALLAGVVVWQIFQNSLQYAYMQDQLFAAIDANRYGDEDTIRNDVIARAGKNGVRLTPQDVRVEIVRVQHGSGTVSDMLGQAGISTSQKIIKVTANYKSSVLLFKAHNTVGSQKTFIEKAQMREREQNMSGINHD